MKSINDIECFVRNKYDIGRIDAIHSLKGGYSRVFRIDGEYGSYVCKEMEPDGMGRPLDEPGINRFLREKGVPVSSFVCGRDGKSVYEDDGMYYHLQTFEKGEALKRNNANSIVMERSAEMLGRLHSNLGALPSLPYGMSPEWCEGINGDDAEEFHHSSLKWASSFGGGEALALLEWKTAHCNELDNINIDFRRLTWGNTHGDFHIYQLLILNNSISAVLDFTGACRLPLCWEVIRSFCYADPAGINGGIDAEHLTKYVRVYLKHFRLQKYDLEKMADFLYFQLLACNYFHQAEHARAENAEHILDVTLWASKICKTLGSLRRELGRELSGLA